MKRDIRWELAVFALLAGLCVAMRLSPHAANFAPVAATALFAGFWFSRCYLAILCPLVAMGLSDTVIGGYNWRIMAIVYAALAFPIVWRTLLRSRLSVVRIAVGVVTSSIVFFLATNLAVWAFSPLYSRTIAGLGECYLAALPFFRNTAASDGVFATVFFGAYVLVRRLADTPVRTGVPVPVSA